jgi:TadE-like protein
MVRARRLATLPVVRGESGQAVVEAAIVLPAFLCLLLCTIQLTQLQQARLVLEYAAFNAARVGIVHDVESGAMREAAVLSILPSWGRTDSWEALLRTLVAFETSKRPGLETMRIRVLEPHKDAFAKYGAHLAGHEIDFDDARAADATLLSIEVRYLYELRVPFANKLLHSLWLLRRTPEDAAAIAGTARAGRYLVPLEAFATMRMQSNPFAKWAAP